MEIVWNSGGKLAQTDLGLGHLVPGIGIIQPGQKLPGFDRVTHLDEHFG